MDDLVKSLSTDTLLAELRRRCSSEVSRYAGMATDTDTKEAATCEPPLTQIRNAAGISEPPEQKSDKTEADFPQTPKRRKKIPKDSRISDEDTVSSASKRRARDRRALLRRTQLANLSIAGSTPDVKDKISIKPQQESQNKSKPRVLDPSAPEFLPRKVLKLAECVAEPDLGRFRYYDLPGDASATLQEECVEHDPSAATGDETEDIDEQIVEEETFEQELERQCRTEAEYYGLEDSPETATQRASKAFGSTEIEGQTGATFAAEVADAEDPPASLSTAWEWEAVQPFSKEQVQVIRNRLETKELIIENEQISPDSVNGGFQQLLLITLSMYSLYCRFIALPRYRRIEGDEGYAQYRELRKNMCTYCTQLTQAFNRFSVEDSIHAMSSILHDADEGIAEHNDDIIERFCGFYLITVPALLAEYTSSNQEDCEE